MHAPPPPPAVPHHDQTPGVKYLHRIRQVAPLFPAELFKPRSADINGWELLYRTNWAGRLQRVHRGSACLAFLCSLSLWIHRRTKHWARWDTVKEAQQQNAQGFIILLGEVWLLNCCHVIKHDKATKTFSFSYCGSCNLFLPPKKCV